MSEAPRPGFVAQIKSYPPTFWVSNTMEIFERMSWYGFFAVSSLYITGPVETGALGFTSEQRGQLQAIVPFFLYLLPVVTGALADRYGYKKMFIIAYSVMVISYYMLGQFTAFVTFMFAFMFVALGAALFKPVIVGTIARLTNESNSATAFGIFYMMVNIGGFFGPLITGAVRGDSWENVFLVCSGFSLLNLIIVSIFYREPTSEATSAQRRTLRKVFDDMVEVLGNLRFFITAFTVLIALLLANQGFDWFTWDHCLIFVPCWLAANFLYDIMLPKGSGLPARLGGMVRNPFLKRMHCSNWRFALFLLIMSGFWTSFQQIFITMPEYIRDFVDTKPMVNLGERVFSAFGKPHWIDNLASIDEAEVLALFDGMVRRANGAEPMVIQEKTPLSANQLMAKAAKQRASIQRLLEDVETTTAQQEYLTSMLASLDEFDVSQPAAAESLLDEYDRRLGEMDREAKIKALAVDPGLTPEDIQEIQALLAQINQPRATQPLEPVDIVDAARTILQYKVRITPVELGRLLAGVSSDIRDRSNEQLDQALKRINDRLRTIRQPAIVGTEAEVLKGELMSRLSTDGPLVPAEAVVELSERFSGDERLVAPEVLARGVRDLAYRPLIWKRVTEGRQVNAEHIINFDAGAIVLFQVLVSFMMARFHRFTTMIVGMIIAAIGISLPALAGGTMIGPVGGLLIVVIIGIVTFAFGEMMASPTSQEYVGRIAPPNKAALYMGYYFVAIALGNLFSGILSGQLYGKLARDMQRPDLMWLAFGGIMFATALVFMLYNWLALPRQAPQTMAENE